LNNADHVNDFDGLLIRGDKNPNTKGLLNVLKKFGISTQWSELISGIQSGSIKTVVVAGPENLQFFPEMKDKVAEFSKAQTVIWLQSPVHYALEDLKPGSYVIPMKSYVEKEGTFINHAGLEQKFKKVTTVVSEALTLSEAGMLLAHKSIMVKPDTNVLVEAYKPVDRVTVENRKKNEFVYRRGTL
jgi:NADH-quinone oxidoreductase subunit G